MVSGNKKQSTSVFFFFVEVRVTCPVCDVDGGAGCRAVSSPSHGVHSDHVVSSGLQVVDGGGGLRAGDGELFRITVASWGETSHEVLKVREAQLSFDMRKKTKPFHELTRLPVSDPVVAHGDGWCVPAHGDAGGRGVQNFQVCGSVGDWRQKKDTSNNTKESNQNESREKTLDSVLVFCFPLSGRLSSPPLTA